MENSSVQKNNQQYWRANIKLVLSCLIVWFIVSFGFGILWVDQVNTIRWGGFKLGFWFAQQGSIYTFLILIIFYVHQMNKLDKKFNVREKD